MIDTLPATSATEVAAALLQVTVTLGLAVVCAVFYIRYRKPYFATWAVAWLVYVLRLSAILSFLATGNEVWLYWHQVFTGWTALALLWAAIVFSQQAEWRPSYLALAVFPPAWSYIAIYRLDNFLLAVAPMVLFMSLASMWTAGVFFRHRRRIRSSGAALLAVSMFLWGLHHLDYPILRARGAWNPWGYYIDIIFVLATGLGIVLLVLEDLENGVGVLSGLSDDLQREGGDEDGLRDALLERLLSLPAVLGSAMYTLAADGEPCFERGVGACEAWSGSPTPARTHEAVTRCATTGRPEVVRGGPRGGGHAYVAALPVLRGKTVSGALVMVGEARDPFAALDTRFLVALGQQVGAALERADLHHRLAVRTQDLGELAARMVHQHEDERRRVSRELHDETAQVFSAVKMQLGLVRESVEPTLAPRLDRALDLVDTGIRSIRNVMRDLRPSLLDDLGLLPALRGLVVEFGEGGVVHATFEAKGSLPPLTDEAELALFRALQEGLANVARHADAETVTVRVEADAGGVTLEVIDDGRGFSGSAGEGVESTEAHLGLVGMRERIGALGGDVLVHDGGSAGVTLAVRVPVGDGVVP